MDLLDKSPLNIVVTHPQFRMVQKHSRIMYRLMGLNRKGIKFRASYGTCFHSLMSHQFIHLLSTIKVARITARKVEAVEGVSMKTNNNDNVIEIQSIKSTEDYST